MRVIKLGKNWKAAAGYSTGDIGVTRKGIDISKSCTNLLTEDKRLTTKDLWSRCR